MLTKGSLHLITHYAVITLLLVKKKYIEDLCIVL